jgi:hypothetical protein
MKTSKSVNNHQIVLQIPLAIVLSFTSAYIEGWINSNHVLDEPTAFYFLALPLLIMGAFYAWRVRKSCQSHWKILPAIAIAIYIAGISWMIFNWYFLSVGSF